MNDKIINFGMFWTIIAAIMLVFFTITETNYYKPPSINLSISFFFLSIGPIIMMIGGSIPDKKNKKGVKNGKKK